MYPRIGQKIVCITDAWLVAPCEVVPEINAIYVIRGIRTYPQCPDQVFILLRELVNPPCTCRGQAEEAAYASGGFRPLVDDEAKNEHVTEILRRISPSRQRERESEKTE